MALIAARQHGVVSVWQLAAAGFSQAVIDQEAAKGRLHRVFRAVYAVGHPQIGERGRSMAAVLACGPRSVLSHGSAAALLGLWDHEPALVHLLASGERGRKIAGIRRHFVPAPVASTTVVDAIRCTNASRTMVDLAGAVGEGTLRRTIEQAAVLGLLDVDEIDRQLAARRRRGAPALRRLLAPWRATPAAPRLRSRAEARFLALVAAAGLPPPEANEVLRVSDRRLEVDFMWPQQRLVVEIDGHAFHGDRAAFERDRRRDQALMSAGYRVMRVTWRQIEDEPGVVSATVAGLLRN